MADDADESRDSNTGTEYDDEFDDEHAPGDDEDIQEEELTEEIDDGVLEEPLDSDDSVDSVTHDLAAELGLDLDEAPAGAASPSTPRHDSEDSSSSSSASTSSSSTSTSGGDSAEEAVPDADGDPGVGGGPGAAVGGGDGMMHHAFIMLTPFAKMSFFQRGNRREFIVKCSKHDKCVWSRTANPSVKKHLEGQGRPLGSAMAWAMQADDFPDKSHVTWCRPTLAQRQEGRRLFSGLPGAGFFLDSERPCRAGEPDEPVSFR